jgi:hypothetical protein
MSNRITIKNLRALCDAMNKNLDRPAAPYTRGEDGRLHANIGNLHISSAYGGHALHEMVNDGGGIRCPLGSGYKPARELYNEMHAFWRGIETAKHGS